MHTLGDHGFILFPPLLSIGENVSWEKRSWLGTYIGFRKKNFKTPSPVPDVGISCRFAPIVSILAGLQKLLLNSSSASITSFPKHLRHQPVPQYINPNDRAESYSIWIAPVFFGACPHGKRRGKAEPKPRPVSKSCPLS